MIDRSPGYGRYAVTEREQRWLLGWVPEGTRHPVEILDKYIHSSTLRLRRMRSSSTTVYKLGQKVRQDPSHPSINQMTNLYLSEPEFRALGEVDGAVLSKTRWRWAIGQSEFSIDVFGGLLQGLVLAEIELTVNGVCPPPPPDVIADVTEDDRFSGSRLASITRPEARGLLKMVATLAKDRHRE